MFSIFILANDDEEELLSNPDNYDEDRNNGQVSIPRTNLDIESDQSDENDESDDETTNHTNDTGTSTIMIFI